MPWKLKKQVEKVIHTVGEAVRTPATRRGRVAKRLDLECKGGWVLCLGGSGRLLEGVNRDFHGSRKVPGVACWTEWVREAMRV